MVPESMCEGLPEACAAAVLDGGEALAVHRETCEDCRTRGGETAEQEALFDVTPTTPARNQVRY